VVFQQVVDDPIIKVHSCWDHFWELAGAHTKEGKAISAFSELVRAKEGIQLEVVRHFGPLIMG